ncbi:MAG: hypothetical protein ACI9U1_001623 [Porticoccaceae bacterium]|jgi:hypothetical protein
MLKHLYLVLAIWVLTLSAVQAETYIRDYTYKASDIDSKVTSRTNALDQVKIILLQEIGTHIRQQINISKDSSGKTYATEDIEAITAGLTKTEILDEKWNGETYYLKAKIFADTERVLNALDEFKKDTSKETQRQLQELKDNQKKLEITRKEVAQLRKLLSEAKNNTEREHLAATYTKEVNKISLWEPKSAFDGRVGTIAINNNSLYQVIITLWHPDSKSPFVSYSIPGQSEIIIMHNSSPINIGSDWGVQIGSKNSLVRTVVDVSSWSSSNRRWNLKTSTFFNE